MSTPGLEVDCPTAGDWSAWKHPSGQLLGMVGVMAGARGCRGHGTPSPTTPPAPCRPEGPHGQARTAGPSLQTLGFPRLGGAPSHFLPKDQSSPGISHPQRTQPLSSGFLQPRPDSEAGREPSPGPHPLLGQDRQEGEAKQRFWVCPPTEGLPRGGAVCLHQLWCRGREGRLLTTSYGCPPSQSAPLPARAVRLLSLGSVSSPPAVAAWDGARAWISEGPPGREKQG